MQVFINECSLQGQFSDEHQGKISFTSFFESLSILSKLKQEQRVYNSTCLYIRMVTSETNFASFLRRNKSINDLFVNNLKILNPKPWEQSEIHNREYSYVYNQVDYVGTSIAEISARQSIDSTLDAFLLNFPDSNFDELLSINVTIDNKSNISIDCAHSADSIYKWLIDKGHIRPEEEYDENSKIPPTDIQTVLRDSKVFELTRYKKNKGRAVYRKIGTHELWSVDGAKKHAGKNAHIEIFDETTGKHLGTSLYKEINIDYSRKVSNRVINLG